MKDWSFLEPPCLKIVEQPCLKIAEQPYLKIVEQPVEKFRFRYKSEMTGMHGTLCARSAISRKPTFPTVAVSFQQVPTNRDSTSIFS